MTKEFKTVDEYVALFPKDTQEILKKIRQLIKEVEPKAEEAISYGIPTYKLNGNLVHLGAFKNHIGFYPTPSAIKFFKKDLSPYKQSKGAVQFLMNEPIPFEIIKKIVKYRVKENLSKKP
jgi:uncharacterized protein YdhG (YjbR/CyaY superfamily)